MWAELEGDDGEDVVSNNVSSNLLEVSAPRPRLRPLMAPGPVAASTTALCRGARAARGAPALRGALSQTCAMAGRVYTC